MKRYTRDEMLELSGARPEELTHLEADRLLVPCRRRFFGRGSTYYTEGQLRVLRDSSRHNVPSRPANGPPCGRSSWMDGWSSSMEFFIQLHPPPATRLLSGLDLSKRRMSMQVLQQRALITPEGKQELIAEIACLRQIRQDILDEPQSCWDGDPDAVRNELSAVERQIFRLREVLSSATPVDDDGLVVAIGSQVTVVGEQGKETFTISGPLAANPSFGHISYESPLGQALLGSELGDEVEVVTTEGQLRLRIVDVRPAGRGGFGGLRRTA